MQSPHRFLSDDLCDLIDHVYMGVIIHHHLTGMTTQSKQGLTSLSNKYYVFAINFVDLLFTNLIILIKDVNIYSDEIFRRLRNICIDL